MNILLYSPDNGVTRNFMPHLWMFLLKSPTPPGHEVFLIDGNAQPMTEEEMARFVQSHDIRLVGISAMTRMAPRAYRIADAIRATGAKVVFGGPHVTEVPDEPLGRDEGSRQFNMIGKLPRFPLASEKENDILGELVYSTDRIRTRLSLLSAGGTTTLALSAMEQQECFDVSLLRGPSQGETRPAAGSAQDSPKGRLG